MENIFLYIYSKLFNYFILVACSSYTSPLIIVWDVSKKEPYSLLTSNIMPPLSICWNHSGNMLASSGLNNVTFFNTNNWSSCYCNVYGKCNVY